jgi:hypothetical protein
MSEGTTSVKIVDSILACDLKELVNLNSDVECSSEDKQKINNYEDDKL